MSDEEAADRDFTDVTYQSYGEKMKASFAGVCIGFLLFFGSWGLLFWNEGRAVKRQKDLDEGMDAVKQLGTLMVSNRTIDNGLQGQLVYVNGMLTGQNASIVDPFFNMDVTAETEALKYKRTSEMYQWKESSSTRTIKTSGGGTRKETTYSYNKVWSEDLYNSGSFRESGGHTNPTTRVVEPYSATADTITLGGVLEVTGDLLTEIDWFTRWSNFPLNASNVPAVTGYQVTVTSSEVMYLKQGTTTSGNTVGDTRVHFQVALPEQVSIVAMLEDDTLKPYITSEGRELYLFGVGTRSSDSLFEEAISDNTTLTWILRFVGFFLMAFGIWLILNPIAAAFDVLPFCGDALEGLLEGCIIPCIAFVISLPLSILIISIAWIFYRPVFAAVTLVMLLFLGVLWIKYLKPKLQKPPPQGGKPPSSNPNNNDNFGQSLGPTANNNDNNFGQSLGPTANATEVPMGQETPYYAGQQNTANDPAPFSMALDTDAPPPPSNNNYYGSAPPQPSAPPAEPVPSYGGGPAVYTPP